MPPRLCLGLFAAAELLGFKFVHGVQPHLYIERIGEEALRKLGLSLETAGREPNVFLRVPKYPEAVFRAAVEGDGVPLSDILQVWLDVSNHPARGEDQANLLRKRVLPQILDKAQALNVSPEYASFTTLVESLRPWLDQVVVVGGWAHRLYRLHQLAQQLQYEPLATLDADIALRTRLKVTGDEIL